MTETELTDQLREAIVLDGPDVWQTNGYLDDARQAGITEADAQKRAALINQEVANNNLLFQNIQARIARLAHPSRVQFYDQDLNQIVNAASSLKLSPDFVRHRWVPTVLKRLQGESEAQQPVPEPPIVERPAPAAPVRVEPVVTPTTNDFVENKPETTPSAIVTPAEPVQSSNPVVERPVYAPPPPVTPVERPVKPPSPPEPAPVVRSFTATPARVSKGQPVTLAWEVDNLLAVTIDDLGEGLSPTNRGWVKPTKTTDYTLFDANNNPLSTVRVEVIKPDRSGLYGVLFALALLAAIYWFIKNTNKNDSDSRVDRKPAQTASTSGEERSSNRKKKVRRKERPTENEISKPTETVSEPIATLPNEPSKRAEQAVNKPVSDEKTPSVRQTPKPATPAEARQGKYEEAFGDKPYDKVELGTDERGWRRARSNGRWGYVNEDDEWVIQPEFEAVTPFRGGTAAVFLNGQLMTINRAGELVKK